jgi:pyruvate/2-oxoglutarate dehydrogenase complex dihydrolipoamide dehydrogenase (E3) component
MSSLFLRTASISIFGSLKVTPRCCASAASLIISAVCNSAFEGMQPTFRHTPPKLSNTQIKIDATDEVIEFEQAIIAAGSSVTKIPAFPFDDPRVMDSTDALDLENVPKRLLIVGGGIIGLEMATVYEALGSEITVVERSDQLIAAADKDIVNPLFKRIKKQYANIFLSTEVTSMNAQEEGIQVGFKGKGAPEFDSFDKVLVSIGLHSLNPAHRLSP